MSSVDKVRERAANFFKIKNIELTAGQLEEVVAEFMQIAAVLGMTGCDELFSFLIPNEAYSRMNKAELEYFRAGWRKDLTQFFLKVTGENKNLHEATLKAIDDVRRSTDFWTNETLEKCSTSIDLLLKEAKTEKIQADTLLKQRLKDLFERMSEKLTATVTESAAKLVKHETRIMGAKFYTSFTCAILAIGIALGGAFWAGMKVSESKAQAQIERTRAAAEWAGTAEGELAYAYAEKGLLLPILGCRWKGWEKRDGRCVPYPAEKDDQGYIFEAWRMPEVAEVESETARAKF